MGSDNVVKVKSEKVKACLTCPLCTNLFTDATTISECLHTFCRDCIYDKITADELDRCPVCNTNLGGVPLEKLRADHTMDDLREKIFPCKRRKEKAPETTEDSNSFPAKRKERPLSSLAITGANTESSSLCTTTTLLKSAVQENLAPQQCPTTLFAHRELIHVPTKQDDTRVVESETDVSNQRVQEEASVTRSNDCNIQGTVAKQKEIQIDDNYCNIQEHGHKPMMDRAESGLISGTSGSVDHGKSQGVSGGRRLASTTNASYDQARGDVDADGQCKTLANDSNPIWFALVASDNQEGNEPLPQISSSYLRVRDGSVPVAFIQKYLMKKLGLASEIEVEISLKGQPVSSTLHLHDLVELWQQTTTKIERIQIAVGSSAKDFVMVLSYGRKAHPPEHLPTILKNGVQQETE